MSKRERKPVPKPIKVQREKPQDQGVLVVPHALADNPRIFLDFLACHSGLPMRYRELIANWLLEYNQRLVDYFASTYGPFAPAFADAISQALAAEFLEGIQAGRTKADAELFDVLEEQFKDTASSVDDEGGDLTGDGPDEYSIPDFLGTDPDADWVGDDDASR